jgi:hypothetical protein
VAHSHPPAGHTHNVPDTYDHPERTAPSGYPRIARLTAAAIVMAALLAGTAWGDDEHFPFGPFRMYSTRNDPNGTISVVKLRGTTMQGEEISLHASTFGLRHAEVDGLLLRFVDDSRLAAHLVEAYDNLDRSPRLKELKILRGFHQLDEGRPVGYFEKTFGVWSRSE